MSQPSAGTGGACGSQLSPGGHELPVFDGATGKVEINPRCMGLDMHNELDNLSYDLHGNNPADGTWTSAGSATSHVTDKVTVSFSNYGAVGRVNSERTAVVTDVKTGKRYTWHLTADGSGSVYWSAV